MMSYISDRITGKQFTCEYGAVERSQRNTCLT